VAASELFLAELRYAARGLRRSPGFALAAMLTLALGIGANTAFFSLVYGILLRPFDYREADRLVTFRVEREFAGRARPVPANFSLPDLEVWRAQTRSFDAISMMYGTSTLLSSEAGTDVITTATVTPTFFSTAGGHVVLGRGLGPADDGSPSVVISHRLWQRAFGGAATIVGQQIVLDRHPYSVVGVADSTFQLPSPRTDAWQPVGYARTLNPSLGLPRGGGFQPLARLKAGATVAQAQVEADVVCRSLDAKLHATAIPLREWFLTTAVGSTLLVLWTAVGLVLFVACANVANLMLARNTSRSREMAIRLALGASRSRLMLQSIVQSGLLAAGGAAGGTLLATSIVHGLVTVKPVGIPRLDAVRVDLPVLLFAAALGLATTAVVGVLPAWQSADVAAVLKTGGTTATGSRRARQARRGLVVAELAVSVVLIVGASLLGRSLVRLLHTDLGVATDRVTSALIDLSFGRHLSMTEQRGLIGRIVERVRSLPGVTSAGAGASMPPNLARLRFTMNRFDDAPGQPANYMVDAVTATPGYFSTLGMRLQRGRFFTDADATDRPQVMIVSASTARQLFGDRDPLGRVLSLPILTEQGTSNGQVSLVGIVADVKYSGVETPTNAVIYRPFAQQPWSSMFIVAHTANDPRDFASTFRREITAVDPTIGISRIDTLESLVADATAQPRFRAVTLVFVAALAVSLAVIGLYGVVACAVSQRTAELGIRMALGASGADVIRLVLGEGMWLAAGGVTIGMIVARALTSLVVSLLYGVEPTDLVSFAAAGIVLLLVAMMASYVPARRASRIDPLIALRTE
jgi:putative ABC transport system permease protein